MNIIARVLAVAVMVGGGWLLATNWLAISHSDDPAPVAEEPFSVGDSEETSTGLRIPSGGAVTVDQAPALEDGGPDSPDAARRVPPEDMPPNHLLIPDLDVSATIDGAEIIDEEMEVPDDVDRTSRYLDGAAPGDDQGTVLLAGHVNTRTQGPGVFARLHEIDSGTEVWVSDDDGHEHLYVIAGLANVTKAELPAELFTDHGKPRLTMVTCGGELLTLPSGGRSHSDNVVATAVPVTD